MSRHRGGTPDFLAFECMAGLDIAQLGKTSTTTDVFAFGIMCIELLEYMSVTGDQMSMTNALAAHFSFLPDLLRGMICTDPNLRYKPYQIAAAFEHMHSVLLVASADTDTSAHYIVEQIGTVGSAASQCAAQLQTFTEFLWSRNTIRTVLPDLDTPLVSLDCMDRTWLVWDSVGCSDQLAGYMVGMARLAMPFVEARNRVDPWLPLVEWTDGFMRGCKQWWISTGNTTSLKEEWFSPGSTLGSQFQKRFQMYPL